MGAVRSTHPEGVDALPAERGPSSRSESWIDRGALHRLRTSVLARDIAIATSVSLVLGLIRLGAPSFWIDEAFTAQEIHFSFVHKVDVQYHVLHLVLLQPWAAVFGTSEWALRLPSVFGAMLAVGLLVVLGNKLFDRRVALISGLLLATSPFLVMWSQQARAYSMFVALVVLAMLLLLRALERGTRGAWAVFGLAFSALLVWQPASGVEMVPAYAALLIQRRERVLPHGLLAAVVVAAIGVPWAAVTAMRSTGEGVAINWLKFPSAEAVVRAVLDNSGAAGLGLLLAVVGLWVLRRTDRSDMAVWLGVWAFCPFVLALLVSTLRPIYLDRYLIGTAPAFALLAAVAVMGVRPRLRWVAALAAVVASSIGLVLWYVPKEGGNWRGEDWRGATHYVQRRAAGDDIVMVPWWAYRGMDYYGLHPKGVSNADSIWVVNWSETGHELPAADRGPLGFGDHVLAEEREFGWRLSVQHWVRKPGS